MAVHFLYGGPNSGKKYYVNLFLINSDAKLFETFCFDEIEFNKTLRRYIKYSETNEALLYIRSIENLSEDNRRKRLRFLKNSKCFFISSTKSPVELGIDKIFPHLTLVRFFSAPPKPKDQGSATHWDDIGGLESTKKELQMYIEWPLKHPGSFAKMDLTKGYRGILLYGPPGCGKTMLARAIAHNFSAHFYHAICKDIFSPFFGESEKNISRIFKNARSTPPAVIFFDEIDSIGMARRMGENDSLNVNDRILCALLREMDGIDAKAEDVLMRTVVEEVDGETKFKCVQQEQSSADNVIVIGATNRIDTLDFALLRPGRFDVRIEVPAPNKTERRKILDVLLAPVQRGEVDLDWLSSQDFTGADLRAMVEEVVEFLEPGEKLENHHFKEYLEEEMEFQKNW